MAVHRNNPRGGSRNSGENVETLLAKTHREISQAGYNVNFMLTKRKLTRSGLETALDHAEEALEMLYRLRDTIDGKTGSSVGPSSQREIQR